FLGSFAHSGAMQREESYVQLQDLRLPERISGNYFVTVRTDALDNVYELTLDTPGAPGGKDGNNLGATSDPINVILRPPPDLQALSANGPAVAHAGDNITVSWSAENRGSEGTGVASWSDSVYLSDDDKLGGDIPVGSVIHQGAL